MSDAVVVLSSPSDSEHEGTSGRSSSGHGTADTRAARRQQPQGAVRPATPLRRAAPPPRSARVDELFATQMLCAAHKDDVVVIDDEDEGDEDEKRAISSSGGDSQATQDPREEEDEEEVPETPGDTVLAADSDEDAGAPPPRPGGSLAERLRRATAATAHRQQQQQQAAANDDDDLLADTQERGAARLPARPYDAFYRPTGAAPDAFAQLTGYRSSTQAPRRTVTRPPTTTTTTMAMAAPRVALARTGRGGDDSAARARELGMLSAEQRAVLQHALAGDSFFFTGAAGTGKSFLLRCIIAALQAKLGAPHVFVTARFVFSPSHPCACASPWTVGGCHLRSTGIAACNISGTTLHSFAVCCRHPAWQ